MKKTTFILPWLLLVGCSTSYSNHNMSPRHQYEDIISDPMSYKGKAVANITASFKEQYQSLGAYKSREIYVTSFVFYFKGDLMIEAVLDFDDRLDVRVDFGATNKEAFDRFMGLPIKDILIYNKRDTLFTTCQGCPEYKSIMPPGW